MIKKIIFLMLFLVGCSKMPPIDLYNKLPNGNPYHQCLTPILYAINDNISDKDIKVIQRAFKYWNKVRHRTLFVYVGKSSWTKEHEEIGGLILVDVAKKDKYDLAMGVTSYNRFITLAGCVSAAIVIYESTFRITNEYSMESIVRHEIGHALGRGHVTSCTCKTCPAPIMMQQTKSIGDCIPNTWPLDNE